MKNILFLFLLFSAISCSTSSLREDGRKANLFPIREYQELQSEQICPDIIMKYPGKMLVIGENLLISGGMRYDSMIHIVNLPNKNHSMLAPYGPGPFDFREIFDLLYISSDSLLAIQEQDNSISYYRVSPQNITLDKETFVKKDRIRNVCFWTLTPFKDYYVKAGIYGEKLLALISLEGDTLDTFGDFPGDTLLMHKSDTYFYMRNKFNIIPNPTKDRIVFAGKFCDWMVFFRQEDEKMANYMEYFSYYSAHKVQEEPYRGGLSVGEEPTEDTILTYRDLYATDEHLYALYYGFPELDKDNPNNTCYILQFSWDGEFQKAYHLQEVIRYFAVDEKRSCIYATYTPKGEDPVLLKYEIE